MKKRPMLNGIVNRIANVGVELEGGWDAPVPGYQVVHDGSVKFRGTGEPQIGVRTNPAGQLEQFIVEAPGRGGDNKKTIVRYAVGEIVSPILQISQLENFVTKCYPPHVNDTCGLHVHMSFTHRLNYSRLMDPAFTPHIIRAILLWGKTQEIPKDHIFWERVTNERHPHCAHLYLGDKQVLQRGKDYHSRGTDYSRYTAINYCDAQHQTIECRVLPMFDTSQQALSAIMCVLDATNLFLSKIRQRERKTAGSVLERPMIFREVGSVVQ